MWISDLTGEVWPRTGLANFGNWSRLLDVVHGTDQRYRRAGAAWLRHTRLLGTTPAHLLYPDN